MDGHVSLAQPAVALFCLSLVVTTPIVYLAWRKSLDLKYNIQWPVLGDKESANLREVVEAQWSKVCLHCSWMRGIKNIATMADERKDETNNLYVL